MDSRRSGGRGPQAGLPARWVTGDEVYGADPDLRAQLETLRLGYVLGIACNRRVTVHGAHGGVRMRADDIAASLGERSWTRYSAGAGAKGPRFYDWAFVALRPDGGPGHRWLLVHRHSEHGELAYYRCYAPRPVALTELVRVAGARWRMEESFGGCLAHRVCVTWDGVRTARPRPICRQVRFRCLCSSGTTRSHTAGGGIS